MHNLAHLDVATMGTSKYMLSQPIQKEVVRYCPFVLTVVQEPILIVAAIESKLGILTLYAPSEVLQKLALI